MKAYLVSSPHIIRLGEAPLPNLSTPGTLLLRTKFVSICSTDLLYYSAKLVPPAYPYIPGHEYCGEVVKGNGEVPEGSHVVYWGQGEFGGLAEYRAILPVFPTSSQVPNFLDPRGFSDCAGAAAVILHSDFPLPYASLLEPICSVLRALTFFSPRNGSNAVVLGGGPMGLIALQLLHHQFGCRDVALIDPHEHKRQRALRLGAQAALPNTAALDAYADLWFDYAFDTVGNVDDDSRIHLMNRLRPGAKYNVYGATTVPQRLDCAAILTRGITVGASPFDVSIIPMQKSAEVLRRAHDLVLDGGIDCGSLVADTICFADEQTVQAAFEKGIERSALKTIVSMSR